MAANIWTVEELGRIAEYWPSHGSNWAGWADVLPGRTYAAIDRKAREARLTRNGRPSMAERATPTVCPFCGAVPIMAARNDGPSGATRWYVACNFASCYANVFVCASTREAAIAHWNVRR